MRSKNPETMQKICAYAENYYIEHGCSPSTSLIADAVGIARGTVHKYLVEMNAGGMIDYDGHDIKTSVTLKTVNGRARAAIVGSVPCGALQYEEENIEEYVSLPVSIFGNGDFYILRASGDSMTGAGIDDGDLVVIKKQMTAQNGDIVVALVNDQNTLKRFYRDDIERKIILHPENSSMEDIVVDDCRIQGVACNIIKKI